VKTAGVNTTYNVPTSSQDVISTLGGIFAMLSRYALLATSISPTVPWNGKSGLTKKSVKKNIPSLNRKPYESESVKSCTGNLLSHLKKRIKIYDTN